jgi:hypothetical protein
MFDITPSDITWWARAQAGYLTVQRVARLQSRFLLPVLGLHFCLIGWLSLNTQ